MENGQTNPIFYLKINFQMSEIRLVNHRPPIIPSFLITHIISVKSANEKRRLFYLSFSTSPVS
jgi:hypothetical protein